MTGQKRLTYLAVLLMCFVIPVHSLSAQGRGEPVIEEPSLPPDITWTFGNVGSSSYRLDSFTPSDIEFAPLGSQDPAIPLEMGKRYQVKVTNYGQHPFEILAKGSSPSQDLVILSMSVNPSLESDPEIDWQDDGRGTVQFTMTMKLYEAMTRMGHTPSHRCRPQLFQMR